MYIHVALLSQLRVITPIRVLRLNFISIHVSLNLLTVILPYVYTQKETRAAIKGLQGYEIAV